MGGACGTYGGGERLVLCYCISEGEEPEGMSPLGLGVDEGIILK